MKLFTKEIDRKLFAQFPKGSDLKSQVVVAKIFNPYGRGRWYLLNSDPDDPDYLWAIVEMGGLVEVGSVSRKELENVRVKPFNLPLERDLGFSQRNAEEIFKGVQQGRFFERGGSVENKEMLENQVVQMQHHTGELQEVLNKTEGVEPWVITKAQRAATDLSDITHYLDGVKKMRAGGMVAGRYYLDKEENEFRYIGDKGDGKGLFQSGQTYVTKSYDDFSPVKKESKLFGFFEKGGETGTEVFNIDSFKSYILPKVEEIAKKNGLSVRHDLSISDGGTKFYFPKPMFMHKEGELEKVTLFYFDDDNRIAGTIEFDPEDDEVEMKFPMWNIDEEL